MMWILIHTYQDYDYSGKWFTATQTFGPYLTYESAELARTKWIQWGPSCTVDDDVRITRVLPPNAARG